MMDESPKTVRDTIKMHAMTAKIKDYTTEILHASLVGLSVQLGIVHGNESTYHILYLTFFYNYKKRKNGIRKGELPLTKTS